MAGDHTWLAVITPWTGDATNHKYFLGSGAVEANPSFNLYVTDATSKWAYALSGPNVRTTPSIPSLSNNLVAGRRLGVSPVRVTQIHKKARGTLKGELHEHF